ncbi:hypothetical protein HN385_01980 [archaeon]|jgi:hypothetical protein|nr:hypothetical protein [archaeon]MBT3451282.1 hypothetical protein [archaeon]MBT6869457.1 hypothetical protein [archaeon]MBT7192620.1 hypothetical protein [archaeon]MBT7380696.1 hypothetical protein [archaeon]
MNNKTIVALLAVALVISLTGTIMSVNEISELGGKWMVISGAVTSSATDTGNTTLEVLANVGLNLDDNAIDLGAGYVDGISSTGIITTDGTVVSWKNSTGGTPTISDKHTLNNTGSTTVNVTVSMDKDDSEHWLCGASGSTCPGDNAQVDVKMTESAGDSCISGEQTGYVVLANTTSKNTVKLCDSFKPTDGTDTFDVHFGLTIPQEAPTGTKTAIFTYIAEAQ